MFHIFSDNQELKLLSDIKMIYFIDIIELEILPICLLIKISLDCHFEI